MARAARLYRLQQRQAAANAYEPALSLCNNSAERSYFQRRVDEIHKDGL